MSEQEVTTATVAVASSHEAAAGPQVIDISGSMVLLTWATFIIATIILYKIAWKPILAALEKRENDIRRSLEEADLARKAKEKADEESRRMLQEAMGESRKLVDGARKVAQETAASIEAKARQQAQALLVNAERDIDSAKNKAILSLRQESAKLAVDLAGKILQKKLDDDESRNLTDQIIRNL